MTGKQLVEARAVLERAGFEVQTERVRAPQPFDQVVDQDPNAGEQADDGSTVTLEVSRGPGDVLVPAVAGLPQGAGDQGARGRRPQGDSRPASSPTRSTKGLAIRTVPREGDEGHGRNARAPVRELGAQSRSTVPDVTGLSRESAESRLRDDGPRGLGRRSRSPDEPEGDVISQDPGGRHGGRRTGATVTITVSTGKPQVDVPDVIGLSERSASSTAASPPGSQPVTPGARRSPIRPRTAWWWSSAPARGPRWTRGVRS